MVLIHGETFGVGFTTVCASALTGNSPLNDQAGLEANFGPFVICITKKIKD